MEETKMIYRIANTSTVSALFDGWEETLIWSCLQGVMGSIYAPDLNHPVSAMAVLGDFTFFAGEVNTELIAYKPEGCLQNFMIMIGRNESWQEAITEYYGTRAKVVSRYATKKEPDVFDQDKLRRIVSSLPTDYRIDFIDESLYELCKAQHWSVDLVSQFKNYQDYQKLGLGVVLHKDNTIVSGASSYSVYKEGIEIEVDTRADCRRQGFASICGARLILECLKRGLYPSWDAQNLWSLALAEKLGYHYSHTYTAVEIWGY